MTKRRDEFFGELEGRLAENKQLSERGGLPEELAPVAAWFGFHVWRVLAVGAFGVTVLGFLIVPEVVERLVRQMLILNPNV